MMSDKIKMTIEMNVTIPQALALQAMFEYWNTLGNVGCSRKVGFYVDGDGNFQPNCTIKFNTIIPTLTDEMRGKAIIKEHDDNRLYDFDPIAWLLRKN